MSSVLNAIILCYSFSSENGSNFIVCEHEHNIDLSLQVPSGESLTFGDDNFVQFEEIGVSEMQNAAFVLVAGGLGERLGYNGIKVDYR